MTMNPAILNSALPLKAQLLVRMLEKLQSGSMRLNLPNGETLDFRGPKEGPNAELQVRQWSGIGRIVSSGDIGVAEAYRDGDIDSPDMLQVLLLALANSEALEQALHGSFIGTVVYRLRHWLNRNTRKNSRKNIHAHYDIGNLFYRLWLDRTMTYSSAIFSHPGQSLDDAQIAKYDRLLRLIDAKPGQHILEIGCGWGGFAEYAALNYGVQVTGISLSREQLAWAANRVKGTLAESKTEFRYQDYRDIKGRFDAIVSIEMLEAVGEEWWPTYFKTLHRTLKPGGKAAIQTITIGDAYFDNYRLGTDFIQQYIFPGGMLPSPQRLRREVMEAGLDTVNEFTFGEDYAETLKRWRQTFEQHLEAIRQQGFDDAFIRLWRFYYWYCEAGFLTRRTDVCQLVLTHQAD